MLIDYFLVFIRIFKGYNFNTLEITLQCSTMAPGIPQKICVLFFFNVNFHEKHCKINGEKVLGYIVWVRNGCKLNKQG